MRDRDRAIVRGCLLITGSGVLFGAAVQAGGHFTTAALVVLATPACAGALLAVKRAAVIEIG